MGSSTPNIEAAAGALARAIARASGVAVLTGAGVSAESGLCTFRENSVDTMDALWRGFDPMSLATPEAFAQDPERVTRWYDWRRLGCLAAEPNPGHLALAGLEALVVGRGGRFTIATQNVDGLHQRAGSRGVLELHGSILSWRCTRTGRHVTPPPTPFERFPPGSPHHPEGLLRPDVVWFGEMLPELVLVEADEAARACGVFLTIGTSGVVYPAAGLLHSARRCGAVCIEVNPDATPASGSAHVSLRAPSGVVLPELLERTTARLVDA